MDKKYEIDDGILEIINGGKVLDSAYEKIDQIVKEAIANEYPKSAVRAMLTYAYTKVTDQMSDTGGMRDLAEILRYFDKKWAETIGE